MKTCCKCNKAKNDNQFQKHKRTRDGLDCWCKECRHEYQKEYRSKPEIKLKLKIYIKDYMQGYRKKSNNSKIEREKRKGYRLIARYGITYDEKELILTEQNHLCAICGKRLKDSINSYVDHDHKTGKIRGILCNNCNSVLGFSNDDKSILFWAIEYLEKFEDKSPRWA